MCSILITFCIKHRSLIFLLILCFTESRGKKRHQRQLLSTVSRRTGTTEGRLCKQQQRRALLVLVSDEYAVITLISCTFLILCFFAWSDQNITSLRLNAVAKNYFLCEDTSIHHNTMTVHLIMSKFSLCPQKSSDQSGSGQRIS